MPDTREMNCATLAATLDREADLLLRLAALLAEQRSAVAAVNPGLLQGLTDELSQVLADLDRSRSGRRMVLATLTGRSEARLSELEALLADPLPARIREARARLLQAAQEAGQQTAINRVVLKRATEHGQSRLQRIFAQAVREVPQYRPGSTPAPPAAGGSVMVNRIG